MLAILKKRSFLEKSSFEIMEQSGIICVVSSFVMLGRYCAFKASQ